MSPSGPSGALRHVCGIGIIAERPALYGQMDVLQYARSAAEYLLGGRKQEGLR